MTRRIPLVFAAFLAAAVPALATDGTSPDAASDPVAIWREDPTIRFDGSEVTLEDFLWIARPIVVFADTPADPRFQEQMDLLNARNAPLLDRDVVVITDTDPQARTDIRRKLRPRGFMMALIGKDGGVKLRKPSPWDVREITRSIDKMPLRRQELRDQRETN